MISLASRPPDFADDDRAEGLLRPPLRVVVVAASPTVRAGLRAMLDAPGIDVVGDAAPGALPHGLANADVLVADCSTSGQGSPAELLELFPGAILVILSNVPPAADLLAAAAPAGRVLLSTEVTAVSLVAAIHAAAQGLIVIDPAFATAFAPAGSGEQPDAAEPLTPRELDVLQAMALGLPNKGIALRLGISEHTVKFHVGTILAKLAAASRTEAVMTGARTGLLRL